MSLQTVFTAHQFRRSMFGLAGCRSISDTGPAGAATHLRACTVVLIKHVVQLGLLVIVHAIGLQPVAQMGSKEQALETQGWRYPAKGWAC